MDNIEFRSKLELLIRDQQHLLAHGIDRGNTCFAMSRDVYDFMTANYQALGIAYYYEFDLGMEPSYGRLYGTKIAIARPASNYFEIATTVDVYAGRENVRLIWNNSVYKYARRNTWVSERTRTGNGPLDEVEIVVDFGEHDVDIPPNYFATTYMNTPLATAVDNYATTATATTAHIEAIPYNIYTDGDWNVVTNMDAYATTATTATPNTIDATIRIEDTLDDLLDRVNWNGTNFAERIRFSPFEKPKPKQEKIKELEISKEDNEAFEDFMNEFFKQA